MAFFNRPGRDRAANASTRPTILVVTDDNSAFETVESVFSSLSAFDIKRSSVSAFVNDKTLDADNFEIAIVDVGDGSWLTKKEFLAARDRARSMPIIFFSEALSSELMRLLIRLDGVDWLQKPVVKRSLIETVLAYTKKLKAAGGQVHAVVSTGGGCGGTTVAVTMAHQIALRRKKIGNSVALFDLDFSKASCGAYLNMPNEYNLDTVIDQPERVDVEFVNLINKRHASGLSVFSFYRPEIGILNQGRDLVLRMLDVVAFQHDQTVVDLPFYETTWKDTVLSSVNTVYIVTTTTVPGLEMAKIAYQRAARLRKSTDGIQILVNHHKRQFFGNEPGRKQVEKIFGATKVGFLPSEPDVMTEAVNRGVLPSEVNGRSSFGSSIASIIKASRIAAAV